MPKITAVDLDRTVTIQRSTSTSNDFNEPVETWADLTTERARRRDVSDGERLAAGQIGSHVMARFTIRSSSETRDAKPSDRLVHEGATWSIQGSKEADEGRHRFLEITAVKDTD